MRQAGEELKAYGQIWTVLQRKSRGYNCVDSGGEQQYIPDDKIESEPQSQLTLPVQQVHWSTRLTSTNTEPITVESVLAELDEIVPGLDNTSQVVLTDFVERKRSQLVQPEPNNEE
jgi:hypothetical protein